MPIKDLVIRLREGLEEEVAISGLEERECTGSILKDKQDLLALMVRGWQLEILSRSNT